MKPMKVNEAFGSGMIEKVASDMKFPFPSSISFDTRGFLIVDAEIPFILSDPATVAEEFKNIVDRLEPFSEGEYVWK